MTAAAFDLASVRARLTGRTRTGDEIRSLNSIRGVAALMVAIFHAPTLFGLAETFPHAYLAVDLFFVLSGFVMLHAYEARLVLGLSLARFAQVRLARLYPLLVIATLLGFAVIFTKFLAGKVPMNGETFAALPLSLALVPAPAGATEAHTAYPFVTQSWSIVWELALCPVLFVWARWVRRGAALIAAAFALVLAVVVAQQGTIDGGWTTPTFWIGALRAVVAFFAGVAVRQWTRRGRLAMWLNLVAALVAALTVAYVTLVHATIWQAELAIAIVGFPLIIAAASQVRQAWIENPIGDRLGEASYSLYMLHNMTVDVLATVLKRVPNLHGPAHFAFGCAWLVAIVAVSWLSWRWVETPLRRFFSRPDLAPYLRAPMPISAS